MQPTCNYSECTTRRKISKKSKKIILGGPPTVEKMTVEELKALSRQVKLPKEDEIIRISRNLRHNLTKAKSRMMHSLKKSNEKQDIEMYENLKTCPSTPSFDYEEDDCSSVSSSSSFALSTLPILPQKDFISDMASIYSSLLYTPLYNSLFDFILHSGLDHNRSIVDSNNIQATEDQINSWLQRGGGGSISPITSLATDQELADLLVFD